MRPVSVFFYFFKLFFGVASWCSAHGRYRLHKPREPTKTRRLNSISSGICQQNTHFSMCARTSKPQEGFTCKDPRAKRQIPPRNFTEERCIAVQF